MKQIVHWTCWLICHISFKTIHLRAEKRDDGFHCVDCGFFKSKHEHLADMNAGGGW